MFSSVTKNNTQTKFQTFHPSWRADSPLLAMVTSSYHQNVLEWSVIQQNNEKICLQSIISKLYPYFLKRNLCLLMYKNVCFSCTVIERRIQQLNTPVPMKYISIPLYKPFWKNLLLMHMRFCPSTNDLSYEHFQQTKNVKKRAISDTDQSFSWWRHLQAQVCSIKYVN